MGSGMPPLDWPVEELGWEPSSWQCLSLCYVQTSLSNVVFPLHTSTCFPPFSPKVPAIMVVLLKGKCEMSITP